MPKRELIILDQVITECGWVTGVCMYVPPCVCDYSVCGGVTGVCRALARSVSCSATCTYLGGGGGGGGLWVYRLTSENQCDSKNDDLVFFSLSVWESRRQPSTGKAESIPPQLQSVTDAHPSLLSVSHVQWGMTWIPATDVTVQAVCLQQSVRSLSVISWCET